MTVAALTAVLGLPSPAHALSTSTLFVNNDPAAHCTDSGTGTAAQPFCTISAAAGAVQPGQTVRVLGNGVYPEEVHITHSGTADQPITFLGGPLTVGPPAQPRVKPLSTGSRAFVLSTVHDVVIRGFQTSVPNAVALTDSSRITLDQNFFAPNGGDADVHVSGASDHVTVSRSVFDRSAGVVVDSGVHDVLITADDFNRATHTPITATDAPGVAVTNDTIAFPCGNAVVLGGNSTGAVIENNVMTGNSADASTNPPPCGIVPRDFEIVLSAGSTAGSKVDYNIVHPWQSGAAYNWGGTSYATPSALAVATGEATHDFDRDVTFDNYNGPYDRLTGLYDATVDSADMSAPGVGTDLFGEQPIDDPGTANLAGSIKDRGAYEYTGLRAVNLTLSGTTVSSPQGPAPFTVNTSVSTTIANTWYASVVGYTFDFGDGSDPVVSPTGQVTHTYVNPGSYTVAVTVTDSLGARLTSAGASAVTVSPPSDLAADFTATQDGGGYTTLNPVVTSPYRITDQKVDWGDNNPVESPANSLFGHAYLAPGSYTVRLTVTDEAGRTTTATKQVQVVFDPAHEVLLPGERTQLLVRTPDSLLNTGANYTLGLWAGFGPVNTVAPPFPPSQVTSLATAYRDAGYLDSYVAAGGKVYQVERGIGPFQGEAGWWGGWREVTDPAQAGPLASVTQITAASVSGTAHLVALSGGRVYETTFNTATARWCPWGDVTAASGLPGQLTQVAAASTGNSLHIAALGSDGHLWIADGDYTRGRWSSGDLTGYIGGPGSISQISVASIGSKFHVLAVSDGDVYQATADYSAGTWTSFANVSAVVGLRGAVTQVAPAATGNTLHLYGVSGGHIYNANGDYNRGVWSPWVDVTAPGAAGATAPIAFVSAAGML